MEPEAIGAALKAVIELRALAREVAEATGFAVITITTIPDWRSPSS